MTIKEVEACSGMTRANIRFYEAEGLLSPERTSNGYRNYSEAEVEILKRIKLLRALHISLEEIKALQEGSLELSEALDRQLAQLALERQEIDCAKNVCETMREDKVCYETLDAGRYLDVLSNGAVNLPPELTEDTIPRARVPWRRFLARQLDLLIYYLVWQSILVMGYDVNILQQDVFGTIRDVLMVYLLMLVLEPFMLSRFGTTPGKWLMDLWVTDGEDRRLSYGAALSRTQTVIWKGMGADIPIYHLVRLWKSYQTCKAGEILDWDRGSDAVITLHDKKRWYMAPRCIIFLAVFAMLFVARVKVLLIGELPAYRGEITVEQFCDNYNSLADEFHMDSSYELDSTGEWISAGNTYVLGYEPPMVTFTEENGIMTGVTFSAVYQNNDFWVAGYGNDMILAIMSYVWAQDGYNPISRAGHAVTDVIRTIQDKPFQSFQFTECGVSVSCQIVYSGYMESSAGFLVPIEAENKEDANNSYTFVFAMEQVDKK